MDLLQVFFFWGGGSGGIKWALKSAVDVLSFAVLRKMQKHKWDVDIHIFHCHSPCFSLLQSISCVSAT